MNLYEGYKVLEFTNNIAGPIIGQWMTEYGADTIHIERPIAGDDSRHYPPVVDGVGLQYYTFNHGKKSVVLDLKDPDGQEIARKLISRADVVIESYKPGAMEKMGLGYEDAKKLNPAIVYVSVSAWGQTGPYRKRPGYDLIAQAASGMMYYNGEEGGSPVKVYTEIGDYSAGLAGFAGVNAALLYRERTGKGQHVDISLVRTLAAMSVKLDNCRIFHKKTVKLGNTGSNILCPYGCFECPDGEWLVICCSNNNLTFKFFHLIGRDDLITDPRSNSNESRMENGDFLFPIFFDWLDKMGTASKAEKALTDAGIPCTRIYSYEDIDKDPHYNEAGWLTDIPMPPEVKSIKGRRIANAPFGFSEAEPVYEAGEHMGESNHRVIEALGYSSGKIDELEEK